MYKSDFSIFFLNIQQAKPTSDEFDLLSSDEMKLLRWGTVNSELPKKCAVAFESLWLPLFRLLLALDCRSSSKFSIYSMAFRRISTLGSRWFGFGQVRFFSVSNASFTFRRRLRSLIVACLRRSGVELFFLHTLHAHVRHLRPVELAVHSELRRVGRAQRASRGSGCIWRGRVVEALSCLLVTVAWTDLKRDRSLFIELGGWLWNSSSGLFLQRLVLFDWLFLARPGTLLRKLFRTIFCLKAGNALWKMTIINKA